VPDDRGAEPDHGPDAGQRRQEIAEIARAYDLQILEDDCYSVAASDIPSLRALAPERVWLVGSVSKTSRPPCASAMSSAPPGWARRGA
jgi:DNA-binding transcriptional MocR family regulator